jgi:16S rRNA (guanine966-N2)-methyltransferase
MAKHAKKSPQGRLRIVAGIWRSRLLEIADVQGLRPTPERIRETLFNWLTMRVVGARCLDLCAGTGALGLEALSRGAAESVFVEKSPVAAATLRSNVATLATDKATLVQTDVFQYLRSAECGQFDIVFLDPPFAAEMHEELCRLLDSEAILRADARVYLEQSKLGDDLSLPGSWEMLKTKTAGNVRYSLFRPGTGGATK